MITQVLRRLTLPIVAVCVIMLGILCLGFTLLYNEQQWLDWSNKCFTQAYDTNGDMKLKKWELSLTPDAFVRLRRTYTNGKQEYFSFQLRRFKDLNYLGNEKEGMLQLQANNDDIIVQTYDDPKGNIDSMATTLTIPVKNMDAEKLDSLRKALLYFKEKK